MTCAENTPRLSACALRLVLAAVLMALAACTRPATVESAWPGGARQARTFSKILVVGVSPDYTTRCRFERMMMDSLNTNGVQSMTSCSRMASKDPLTREAVVEIVRDLGADAVLSTRLVDGKVKTVEGGSDEARGEAYYKPVGYGYMDDPFYGSYGLPITYVDFVAEAPTMTMRRTVVVSSNLYETQGATVVYTLDTATYDKKSQGEVIDSVTDAIAKRLRRDGLLR
jgi:hypothetical protein